MLKKIRQALKKNLRKNEKGFTLVELMVVVVILGILASVVIPRVATSRATAQQRADEANISILQSAAERYQAETGDWPSEDLNELDPNYVRVVPTPPNGLTGSYEWDSTNSVVVRR